jgi:hypothetical protein
VSDVTTRLKYGKLPSRQQAVHLRFSDLANTSKMPTPPADFGHERLVPQWGMLLNDRLGDCAIAGSLHETMLWNAEAGKTVNLDTTLTAHNSAAVNYHLVTGYKPGPEIENPDDAGQNPTDQGTDMVHLCSFRRRYGLIDASKTRHKVGAYIALEPGNWEQLKYATYYFDGVGIGIQVPDVYQQDFAEHKPWDKVANPNIEGGHYITAVAWHNNMVNLVTWGSIQPMTQAGYEEFNDETYAYLTQEKLKSGVDLEGFNFKQLTADLQDLTGV